MPADLIGLVPAAGQATRLGVTPCSKEILPVSYVRDGEGHLQPVAACESLIEKLRRAGTSHTYFVLRAGKWDIPSYLGDGGRFGVHLGYLMMRHPWGQPFTLDAAYPFVKDATVLLGFPDILFEEADAFVRLLEQKRASGAEVVLGLFPARRPEKMDMVQVNETGQVLDIVIKPRATDLTETWLIAAWSPEFTGFLNEFVARRLREEARMHPDGREYYVGDVMRAAMSEGMSIDTVRFAESEYIDIGTPDELFEAVRNGVHAVPSHAAPLRPGIAPRISDS
jgi:glucose-1-phosphate thymidylyltransferase